MISCILDHHQFIAYKVVPVIYYTAVYKLYVICKIFQIFDFPALESLEESECIVFVGKMRFQ